MNTQTDNTQNTAEEFRQAAKRLGDGVAMVAKTVPWATIGKGTGKLLINTGKLAINILRYTMGLSIYGFIIWPYRFLVAPTCAVAAGMAATQPEDDGDVDIFGSDVDIFGNPVDVDIFGNPTNPNDHSMFPTYIDNWTGDYTFDSDDSHKPNKFGF